MPIPKLLVTGLLMAAQVGAGMLQRIKGPRLESLKTTTAEYGTPIPRFWGKRKFEVPVIWAEDLREKKKTGKGKGGKSTTYKYFGTFAVLIADHEIEAVTRIWFDDKLVYDMTNAGPTSIGALLATSIGLSGQGSSPVLPGNNMRIYLGTEDQSPDPRMVAWCEDRYGADSCPAYRGSAYIVFEELPLEKSGNRIPNITVEAVSVKSNSYLYEDETNADTDWNHATISKDAARLITGGPFDFQIWDVASRAMIRSGYLPGYTNGTGTDAIWTPDSSGCIWAVASAVTPFNEWYLGRWDPDGASQLAIYDVLDDTNTFRALFVLQCLQGATDTILMTGGIAYFGISTNGAPTIYSTAARTGSAWIPKFGCMDSDGAPWVVGNLNEDVTFYNVADGSYFTVDIGGTPTGEFGVYHYADTTVDHFILFTSLGMLTVERGGSHTVSSPISFGGSDIEQTLRSTPPGRSSLYFTNGVSQIREYSCVDGSLVRTLSSASWTGDLVGTDNGLYDAVNHAWLVYDATIPGLRWYFLDRIGSPGVTLADVVDDVSDWVGLTGQDTSALTQPIAGYSVTQGSGKDMLDPLLTIHDVDARPHDFGLQFLVRGGSASGTLLTEDFVRQDARYSVTIQQDTDLPKNITVDFADVNADQQKNTVISSRPLDAVDTTREEHIDLSTYATDPDTAQQLSDRRLRRLWNERERTKLSLTAQNLALEPGDVKTVSLDGETRPARLDKLTISGSTLNCEFIRSEPSLHTLNGATGAEMEGRDPDIIFIPSLAKGVVLDIPLITDSHNDVNPLLYYAAAGYTDPFSGAALLRGDDGSYDDEAGFVEIDNEATIGYATDVLASTSPNVWDRGSSVNLQMVNGTLTSSTEAAIDADPTVNLAAIGQDGTWEIVNFTTATLESDGSYTLSGFKRGRRGTEVNIGDHAVGDTFVLLNNAYHLELGSDDIADALSFKAVAVGRSEETATPLDLTFAGNTLKPYAPARLKTYYNGTDLVCTIYRRTRIGGDWLSSSTIPLSENSEEYEVDVYNGATFKRTITVSDTTSFTYTAAMATADGITLPAQPAFYVYQMSDAVGRGFALAA